MIDIIIPTLWKCDIKKFHNIINEYIKCSSVNKIIIIDNTSDPLSHDSILINEKIKIHKTYRNFYVNQAWNLGVSFSSEKVVGLFSDDVFVSSEVLDYVNSLNFDDIDLIGADLKDNDDLSLSRVNFDKNISIGIQKYGFGCCMFVPREKYNFIPHMYKIWYGDDYLIHNSKNIYTIGINKNKIDISKTIKSFSKNSYIRKVIEMDVKCANKFLLKK